MKRRDFLKAAAAIPAGRLLPAVIPQASGLAATVADMQPGFAMAVAAGITYLMRDPGSNLHWVKEENVAGLEQVGFTHVIIKEIRK